MTEIYLSRYNQNGSVEPPETVAQDIVDRLLALETGPRGWTAVSRDAIAEIKLLRDYVDESTAALSRTVTALMCKVDDNNWLRAELQKCDQTCHFERLEQNEREQEARRE